jgi:hypothetical protein
MLKIPREMKIYFIALALISLSYVAIYYEMVQAHEVAHQKAFEYFGINSTIVFYSPFEAKTVPQSYNLSSEDTRFLYFIQSLNEVFEYQFVTLIAFVFLSMIAIITAIFILVASGKKREEI